MWTNRQSYLLLIHLKKLRGACILIPLALPVFETTLAAVRDSLEVWENLFPNLFAGLMTKNKKYKKPLRLSMLLTKCILLFRELRKYKSYDLVHIDDGKMRITIRLI